MKTKLNHFKGAKLLHLQRSSNEFETSQLRLVPSRPNEHPSNLSKGEPVHFFTKMAYFAVLVAVIVQLIASFDRTLCQDILGCGGFVRSEVEINYSLVEVSKNHECGPQSVSPKMVGRGACLVLLLNLLGYQFIHELANAANGRDYLVNK